MNHPSPYLDHATAALKEAFNWYSTELKQEVKIARWGNYGTPLLLFPTAGGDAEEVERFLLVKALAPFIHEGRLKVYSVDSVNGRTWLTSDSVPHRVWIHQQFEQFIASELVPLIRTDCRSDDIEIMTAGASIGAFNALLAICRQPQTFSRAICMSGTYDLEKWLEGQWFDAFHNQSPVHFVPGLPEGDQLQKLRERFVLVATGQGENEAPGESWKVSHALGQQGIPNRVDLWEPKWNHDWSTWRAMLPQYVQEMLLSIEGV